MSVQEVIADSEWQLLQGKDLPPDSYCAMVQADHQRHVWHAWNSRSRFCAYHHIGGLKAPVARVVQDRRDRVVVMVRR